MRKTSYYTATRINELKSARSKDAYMYFPFGWISTGCLPERFELLSAMGGFDRENGGVHNWMDISWTGILT